MNPLVNSSPTIYALASGKLPAAIAIIRISGQETRNILQALAKKIPPARTANLEKIYDWEQNLIDEALIFWFPAPHSYTGEDCAELHLHGSIAILTKIFIVLENYRPKLTDNCQLTKPYCRLAEPGEFTKRAVINERIDITRAQAIGDLITAKTEKQHHQALTQMQGNLFQYYDQLRKNILTLLAHSEAAIDFSEEEDFANHLTEQSQKMQIIADEITNHLDDAHRGEIIRQGLRIALIGPPNTGKSTLLNKLAMREVAIITPIAGTTRDLLEINLNIAGYEVIFTDTAGIRASVDVVESEGIRRSKKAARLADLTIAIQAINHEITTDEADLTEMIAAADLLIVNKIDLMADLANQKSQFNLPLKSSQYNKNQKVFWLSLHNETGFNDFFTALSHFIAKKMSADNNNPSQIESTLITHKRYRDTLFHVKQCLSDAIISADNDAIELVAENLRHAALEIGKLTGHVDVESLLDQIFADFCIGK